MANRRLYLPAPLTAGTQALEKDRQHYLKNVLRIRDGATLTVFDGLGSHAQARVSLQGRALSLNVEEPLRPQAREEPRVHLAFGLLKGKAMEQVLRKSTELGATDLWPLYTDHTHVPKRALQQTGGEHWHNILVSAAEQCGQNYLPTLHDGQHFAEMLANPPARQMLLTDASGGQWPADLPYADTLLLIGPEGGWSEPELTQATATGIATVNLGPLVLRAETAPLAALATLHALWRFNAAVRSPDPAS